MRRNRNTAFPGFVVGWMRTRPASIWRAAMLHSTVDVSGVVLGA